MRPIAGSGYYPLRMAGWRTHPGIARATTVALVALAGCYRGVDSAQAGGEDGDASSEGGASESGDTADTGASACETQSAAPLRRLSEAQYRNTVIDLLAPAGIDIGALVGEELDRLPADDIKLEFRILDSRLSDMHAKAYYRIARSSGAAVIGDETRLAAIAGDCALAATPDGACIDAFLDDFGLRAMRRPLEAEERERYYALASAAPDRSEAWRSIILTLLLTPQFLYHVELEGEGDDLQYDLGPYELASRLSYHFWQSMPDQELFAAAADGSILTDDGYQAQLDRVFADARTQTTVDRFYDEWFRLESITQFPTNAAFQTFAEGTTIGEPGADHLAAARAEIHDLTRWFTWTEAGTIADLFLTELSFARSPHLAELYGVEPWNGEGEPPAMPAGQRAGILTRTAILVTGTHETGPVHRGAMVRRRMMCMDLPAPDPAALPPGSLDPPPVTPDQTTRERYEAKTADALCQSCHGLINPVGFVLERYDAIGRYRNEEIVIDQATGEVLATLPIDSTTEFAVGADSMTISSGAELSEQVVASGELEGCFARQYFRATFGREESEPDACAVDQLTTTVTDGSLREAMRAVAEQPVFRSRRVE
jgi:Protein of unknown function (DUF1588)/Protein of unknown function (DUF1592)/Protein of unknown function (DUF1595)/Protein of unknown function (DUF1587)